MFLRTQKDGLLDNTGILFNCSIIANAQRSEPVNKFSFIFKNLARLGMHSNICNTLQRVGCKNVIFLVEKLSKQRN